MSAVSANEKNDNGNTYKIFQITDVCKPVLLKQPVFVRFNKFKLCLEYLNQDLIKMEPHRSFEYVDMKYFGYADTFDWVSKL